MREWSRNMKATDRHNGPKQSNTYRYHHVDDELFPNILAQTLCKKMRGIYLQPTKWFLAIQAGTLQVQTATKTTFRAVDS